MVQLFKTLFALSVIACFVTKCEWQQSYASEAPGTGGLDVYLKQLDYEEASFQHNQRNEPLIEARINSHGYTLLADTGCAMTILGPRAARDLKTLGKLGVTLEDSVLGQITNSSVAIIDKLVIGRGQFLNQPALVKPLDVDYVSLRFSGILGLDFFFRNFCLIDCYHEKLFLRATRASDKQSAAMEESLRRSGFTEASLRAHRLLSVTASVKERPVRLLVDTGDSFSVLDQSLATPLNLSSIKWDEPIDGSLIRQDVSGNLIGFGRIGTHRVWVTILSSFHIGSREWTNIPYGVTDLSDWGFSKLSGEEAQLQGIFGNDWLRRSGAIIDFSNLKLWFRPEKGAAIQKAPRINAGEHRFYE